MLGNMIGEAEYPTILWIVEQPALNYGVINMESIIGPLVAAFAANTQYDTEGVVTYEHMIFDHDAVMVTLYQAELDKEKG